MIDCLRSFCLVKSQGFAHLVALGLFSMMSHCVIVTTVKIVDLTGMHKTGCSGNTTHILNFILFHALRNVYSLGCGASCGSLNILA